MVEYNPNETHIFTGDSYEPFIFNQPIKKVLDAICGSEEHLNNNEKFHFEHGSLIFEENGIGTRIFTRNQVKAIKLLFNNIH
ncbi:hypothetical protein S101189_01166 [Pediococcus acidilactici]|uniref:hypothetical protein n=1 Tax=Pediococcus acidilactici TaxID=1254 RepID=UPI0007EF0768|nr:hypothetical protein [Pediococcus acidilactici]ARW24602.1 hypothetical protein S100424_01166 [Pediococcus acidilactici]ARW26644.1 hypothetical protein S100313_01209 [Pediococcus acidilactici]ARW28720.1 hypothetical protein S101189_01166 [Pediococcus acidilactici]OBR30917.1 hypothetical protein SRCM100320_00410 [Pediococcus acidilactici]TLQ01995.1 hypothetical protein FEZ49_02400 [Pediococcus acidilactici]